MENNIGQRIKQRRKELGLTQTQIKQQIGISSGNLSEIENGSKLPSAPTLISLSSILNCSIDWILKGTPSNSDIFLSDERCQFIVNGFLELPEEEKDELVEILHMKLRKTQKARGAHTKLSNSTNTEKCDMIG